jgi:hypothetical protein
MSDELVTAIQQLERELEKFMRRLETTEYLRSRVSALEDEINALYDLFYDLGIEHPLDVSVGERLDYRNRIQKGNQ